MVHHSALDIQKSTGNRFTDPVFNLVYRRRKSYRRKSCGEKEAIVWELSEREMRIVEKLSGQ